MAARSGATSEIGGRAVQSICAGSRASRAAAMRSACARVTAPTMLSLARHGANNCA